MFIGIVSNAYDVVRDTPPPEKGLISEMVGLLKRTKDTLLHVDVPDVVAVSQTQPMKEDVPPEEGHIEGKDGAALLEAIKQSIEQTTKVNL